MPRTNRNPAKAATEDTKPLLTQLLAAQNRTNDLLAALVEALQPVKEPEKPETKTAKK